MSLITLDELARGAVITVFGGAAGVCTLAFPGSPLWLLPASLCVGGCALTVPEIRQEVARAMPQLAEGAARARAALPGAAWSLPGVKAEQRPQSGGEGRGKSKGAPALPAGALPPRAWLEAVNDRPDDNPHMTVVGPSGTGKTTFVSAALSKRPGRVVVLTPKVSPAAWRGAEVVTLDDDLSYMPIAQALDDLQTEARRRAKALQRGEPLEPMTVVLDELPELHAEIPGAGKFAVRLSRWGRELNIRQVVIATSDDALNIPGWAATRPNYVRVELAKPTEDGARPAWLDDGQARRPIDLGGVKSGAERAQLRPWRGEAPAPATRRAAVAADAPRGDVVSVRVPERQAAPDPLLASLMAEPPADARAQVPDIAPERAERLARILGGQGLTAQSVVRVASAGGDTYVINAAKAEATATPPPAAPPRPRKVMTPSELAARREWANYYKRAARAKPAIPFDRAYQAAPVKGNRNRAHAIYKAALPDTAS